MRSKVSLALLVVWFLLVPLQAAFCEGLTTDISTSSSITPEILEAKIQEVEAASDIEEETKAKLAELYRKALSHVQKARSNAEATVVFRQAAQTAPAQILALTQETDEYGYSTPQDSLQVDQTTPLAEVEQLLEKEKVDLAAVEAKRADLDKRLENKAGRPAPIRQRLTGATQRLEKIAARLKLPAPTEEGPVTSSTGLPSLWPKPQP